MPRRIETGVALATTLPYLIEDTVSDDFLADSILSSLLSSPPTGLLGCIMEKSTNP